MSDLTSLMSIAPGTSAFFMGQNQAQQRALKELEQLKTAAEMAQGQEKHQADMQMNPLKMRHQDLQNQTLQESLGGVTAKSEQERLKAENARLTQGTDVAATNALNLGNIDDEAEKKRIRARNFLLQAGPELELVPAPLRLAAFRKMIEDQKMNMESPQVQRMLAMAQQNPAQLPAMLRKIQEGLGEQGIMANPAAYASRKNNEATNAAHLTAAREQNASQEKIANMRKEERLAKEKERSKKADDILERLRSGRANYEQAATAFQTLALFSDTEEERAKYAAAAAQFGAERLKVPAAGQAGKPTLDGQGGLTPRTVETGLGQGGKAAPSATGPFTDAEKERRYQEWKAKQAK